MLKELCVTVNSPGQTFSFLEEIRTELLLEGVGSFPSIEKEEEAETARRREQSEPSGD